MTTANKAASAFYIAQLITMAIGYISSKKAHQKEAAATFQIAFMALLGAVSGLWLGRLVKQIRLEKRKPLL